MDLRAFTVHVLSVLLDPDLRTASVTAAGHGGRRPGNIGQPPSLRLVVGEAGRDGDGELRHVGGRRGKVGDAGVLADVLRRNGQAHAQREIGGGADPLAFGHIAGRSSPEGKDRGS